MLGLLEMDAGVWQMPFYLDFGRGYVCVCVRWGLYINIPAVSRLYIRHFQTKFYTEENCNIAQ